MDAPAKNLSGGQKRKLSVGIAILGDPKVGKKNPILHKIMIM